MYVFNVKLVLENILLQLFPKVLEIFYCCVGAHLAIRTRETINGNAKTCTAIFCLCCNIVARMLHKLKLFVTFCFKLFSEKFQNIFQKMFQKMSQKNFQNIFQNIFQKKGSKYLSTLFYKNTENYKRHNYRKSANDANNYPKIFVSIPSS